MRNKRGISGVVGALLMAVVGMLPLAAQGLPDLPTDLYVLTNEGIIERYGLDSVGAEAVTAPDTYILDFGIDAFGQRLAYRTESELVVIGLSGGEGITLEPLGPDVLPPVRGAGDTIAWSPTGDALAYTTLTGARVYLETASTPVFYDIVESPFVNLTWSPGGTFLAAQTAEDVWWVYRRESTTMSLASVLESSIGTTWVSNSELVFAPAAGGLKLMNLEAANAQTTLLDESARYRLPTLTADDRLAFFGLRPGADATASEGRLLTLSRGAPQVETTGEVFVPLNGLQWAPRGELLTLLQGGILALVDPVTGEGIPLATQNIVAYDWATTRASAPPPATDTVTNIEPIPVQVTASPVPVLPTAAPPTAEPTQSPLGMTVTPVRSLSLIVDGFFLSDDTNGVAQVWQLPADNRAAFRFTGASTDISEFAASPDGTAVAYVTDGDLWLQRLARPQPVRLATLNGFAPVTADISPDGTRVAYTDETANGGGIWIAYTDGVTPPERVIANVTNDALGSRTYRRPQFSPDGGLLLVDAYGQQGVRSAIASTETWEIAELSSPVNDPRPVSARWLNDGRILSYRDATSDGAASPGSIDPGLYIVDPDAGDDAPVEFVPLPVDAAVRDVLPVDADTYRVLLTGVSDTLVRVVDLSGFDGTVVTAIANLLAPRISPDGRFIAGYETLIDFNNDDIFDGALVVVDLERGGAFRLEAPPSLWNFRWVSP